VVGDLGEAGGGFAGRSALNYNLLGTGVSYLLCGHGGVETDVGMSRKGIKKP